jgi:hypothetical protein
VLALLLFLGRLHRVERALRLKPLRLQLRAVTDVQRIELGIGRRLLVEIERGARGEIGARLRHRGGLTAERQRCLPALRFLVGVALLKRHRRAVVVSKRVIGRRVSRGVGLLRLGLRALERTDGRDSGQNEWDCDCHYRSLTYMDSSPPSGR